jgi:hypothetical protein
MIEKIDIEERPEMKAAPKNIESQLLMMMARLELDIDIKNRIKEILKFDINWNALVEQSVKHGITGLLYVHLNAMREELEIPEDVLGRLHQFYLMFTASGLGLEAKFKQVVSKLNEAHIDLIVLKGMALVETLYKDYGLRPMSDIDVLIREKDWPVVSMIMDELDFKAGKPHEAYNIPPKLTKYDVKAHLTYVSGSGAQIEYQFDLLTLGLAMVDVDGVWGRSRPAKVAGENVRLLCEEDMLLQLIIHANRHGCAKFKWLVDVAEKLRQAQRSDCMDWRLFIEIARKERLRTSVYSTLRHVEEMYNEKLVPEWVYEELKPVILQQYLWKAVWPERQLNSFQGRHEDAICFYFYRPFSGWNLINYVIMGRVLSKLAFIIRFMFPPLEWMSYTYNESKPRSVIKYYLKRTVIRRSKA